MKIADRVGGLLLLVFAGYVFTKSLSLGYVTAGVPSAGFLSLWASVIMAISAVMILVKSWKKPLSGPLIANRTILWRTVIFGLAMVMMVFLMPYIGMLVTLAFFVLFSVLLLGARRPLKIVASVVFVPLFVYVLFQLILRVPLPVGPWGF